MTADGAVREEFQNDLGEALVVRRHIAAGPWGRFAVEVEPLEERLELVRGVGSRTRERLVRSGYLTLFDLVRHPRFGKAAAKVCAAIARRDAPSLVAAGAREVDLLPLFRREEMAVVDIETTGLAQSLPVFLIGVAYALPGGWEIRQYLARGFEEEAAILRQAALDVEERRVCVSYNGKAFDEPFVRARFRLYGLPPIRFSLHVDLLHACRRRFGHLFPNCRLTTIAHGLLGLDRQGDIRGEEVPDLYYRYVRDGDEEAIAPVIEHNAADLKALAWLLDSFLEQPCELRPDEGARMNERSGAPDLEGSEANAS